jgi:hypothetical protein
VGEFSLHKQYRRISIVTENGIRLVGQQVAEDGVLFLWILKRVINGLFFLFCLPPQVKAYNAVKLVKLGFQSKNGGSNIETMPILNIISITMLTCERLLGQ